MVSSAQSEINKFQFRKLLQICALLIPLTLLASPVVIGAMSKSEAASKAKRTYSGKVLSVDLVGSKNGKDTYRVKLLLPDGRVKTVTVSG